MWFIGVEVEQETSAPPPEKNPGSAPEREINLGTSATVRLIEVVHLIRCPLHTGFTVLGCKERFSMY